MPGRSIGDALFTKTQQRLLSVLYGHPDQSFYLNELVRLAQIGRGSVVQELAKLTESGLVIMTPHGNQHHYQANQDTPIFQELCSLVQKTFGIREILQTALAPLADQLEQPRLELVFTNEKDLAHGSTG